MDLEDADGAAVAFRRVTISATTSNAAGISTRSPIDDSCFQGKASRNGFSTSSAATQGPATLGPRMPYNTAGSGQGECAEPRGGSVCRYGDQILQAGGLSASPMNHRPHHGQTSANRVLNIKFQTQVYDMT